MSSRVLIGDEGLVSSGTEITEQMPLRHQCPSGTAWLKAVTLSNGLLCGTASTPDFGHIWRLVPLLKSQGRLQLSQRWHHSSESPIAQAFSLLPMLSSWTAVATLLFNVSVSGTPGCLVPPAPSITRSTLITIWSIVLTGLAGTSKEAASSERGCLLKRSQRSCPVGWQMWPMEFPQC